MKNEWLIDVLADLRQFALRNNYIGLAEQLDDSIVTAAAELLQEAEAQPPRLPPLSAPHGEAHRAC